MQNGPKTNKRLKRLKSGWLMVYYANHPQEGTDIIFQNGDGTSRSDSHLLNTYLGSDRPRRSFGDEVKNGPIIYDPSLIDQLISRGYDITTLEFRIKKLPT